MSLVSGQSANCSVLLQWTNQKVTCQTQGKGHVVARVCG